MQRFRYDIRQPLDVEAGSGLYQVDRSYVETQTFFHNIPMAQTRNNQQQGNWRSWPSLRLKVIRLPFGVTTRQIHNKFEQYGNLVRISIFETRQGGRSSTAEIEFDPIPEEAFWGREIVFEHNGERHYVKAFLADYQNKKARIQSPVNEAVTYPERIEVLGDSLDFGILSKPETMTTMASTAPSKLLLDLKRKEIEVHFTYIQSSSREKARSFRFQVALDDQFDIWQFDTRSFVLHLSKTPWYTKMLDEAKDRSHSKDNRTWSVEDMWARQTDLCTNIPTYRQLERMPIGLPKALNDINISRWTTFQFHVSSTDANEQAVTTFLSALRDWNITVHKNENFAFVQAPPNLERDTWALINGLSNDEGLSSFQHELSRIHLSFPVRYQLEVCISNGWLSEYSITMAFLQALTAWPEAKAKQALVYVASNAKRIFDPMIIVSDIEYVKPIRSKQLPENCIEVHSATITATGIVFHTPSVEITNRIIRKHKSQAHRFLRVRFEDDDYRGQTKLWASFNNKMITVFNRVKRTLTWGIQLGDITYDFLAWGNSQLREHGCWMVASTSGMTADRIREEMGSFKETVVAKKAARMGQCFSTTKPVQLGRLPIVNESTVIPDIKRGRFTFTDGVGKISRLAANMVSNQLQIKGETPCLFQFRLGGCKGVLAVSNDIPGIGVEIRESQFKFNSLAGDLEIIRCAEFWQPFLNRQLILCLSHLKVPANIFMQMQKETMTALNEAMLNDDAAVMALRNNVDPNSMTLSLCDLVDAGFRRIQEPFVTTLLSLWRSWSLKYLKEKAKIPVAKGAFVLGTVDETGILKGHTNECPSGDRDEIEKDPNHLSKLPQIFIQITDVATGKPRLITGVCILARNPSLHPGDIRVVLAVDVPALRHMRDVVVMPQTGDRDLPSMCSGGDLDGDDYIVSWDKNLIPQTWNVEPFHYEPPPPRRVANEITTTHLIDFFYDYLRYDALGRIAHAHLGAADFLEEGLDSGICHELLELHSQAVDYPKTGVPAIMERRLQRDRWPHFMEKKRKKQYHSYKVLGQLYDAVQTAKFEPNYEPSFDTRILNAFEPSKELYENVQAIKYEYDNALRRILTQHDIATEFELWSTFVLTHSKAARDYKFHEEVGHLSRVLKSQFYDALCNVAGGKDFDHLAPVAVTAYRLTQYQLDLARSKSEENSVDEAITMPFISFPWLLQETLIKIAAQADDLQPKKTTATVKDGAIREQKTDLVVDSEGNGYIQIPDIKDLNLTSSKLSEYLPDPALTDLNCRYGTELEHHDTEGKADAKPAEETEMKSTPALVNILDHDKAYEMPSMLDDPAIHETGEGGFEIDELSD